MCQAINSTSFCIRYSIIHRLQQTVPLSTDVMAFCVLIFVPQRSLHFGLKESGRLLIVCIMYQGMYQGMYFQQYYKMHVFIVFIVNNALF